MRRLYVTAFALALFAFVVAPASPVSAKTTNYHVKQTVPWNFTACGITFSGWIHEQQQYTLTPTGQLNFHYIANGQAEGVDANGNKASLKINNKEVDHVLSPFIPMSPESPDVNLQTWVENNVDITVEINAQFNMRAVGKGNGRLLQNQWIFEANHNGTQVDSIKWVDTGCF